jgi:23S rRNA (uridine2552-2'-O)-methyltransferase
MYERKDALYRRAKREGYRSRAAYKLLELQRRTRLLKRGDVVIDLGAWPGGWLQVAAELVGPEGRVLGIDLVPIDALPLAQVALLCADVAEPDLPVRALGLLGRRADVILSDLAPKLSGVAPRDQARSVELVENVLRMAAATLRTGGALVIKMLGATETASARAALRATCNSVRLIGLDATRKGSSELYLVALGYRARPA